MPIPDDDPVLDDHTEREVAKRLFNRVWDLLEQPSRTGDEDELGDFDLAFAYEAISRAHMVAGDAAEASRFAAIARTAANRIEDDEDREVFLGDLADLPSGRF